MLINNIAHELHFGRVPKHSASFYLLVQPQLEIKSIRARNTAMLAFESLKDPLGGSRLEEWASVCFVNISC